MKTHPLLNKPVDQILGDEHSKVELVDVMSEDIALKVVNSARISFGKSSDEFSEKDQKLAKFLWNHEHTSPFRHSFYTFAVTCPLFVFRQWVKYQVGSGWRSFEADSEEISMEVFDHMFDTDKGCSWNEFSGRYAVLDPQFYIPSQARITAPSGSKQKSIETEDTELTDSMRELFKISIEEQYKRYQHMLDIGVAKEMARQILPQNIYTHAYWTVSLQGVIHFLRQRLKDDAQKEIQLYAQAIQSLVQEDLEKLGIEL